MKIIILHGDDSIKSYERLRKFIDTANIRKWDVRKIEENSLLAESLSSTSLFQKENLFIFDKPETLTKKELLWLKNKSESLSGTLVLYRDDIVGKRLISSLPEDTRVEEFKLPKIIFQFLDSFYPGNAKHCLELLHEVIVYEPIEFVFALLVKQVRNLFWVKVSPQGLPFPTWQVDRLKSQTSRFGNGQLENIISELSKIDIDVKTSKADLLSSLDLLIITKLQ